MKTLLATFLIIITVSSTQAQDQIRTIKVGIPSSNQTRKDHPFFVEKGEQILYQLVDKRFESLIHLKIDNSPVSIPLVSFQNQLTNKCWVFDGGKTTHKFSINGKLAIIGATKILVNQDTIVIKDSVQLDQEITNKNIKIHAEETYDVYVKSGHFTKLAGNDTLTLIINSSEELVFSFGREDDLVGLKKNYVVISAIKSVSGEIPSSELFDAQMKFNFSTDGIEGRSFLLMGLDINFNSDSTTKQTEIPLLNEALLAYNIGLLAKSKFKQGNPVRMGFIGPGIKVFDQNFYIGGHFGFINMEKQLFSSYLILGYYRDLYGSKVAINDSAKIDEFRNNIYLEFSLATPGIDIPILSDIRLKTGILLPMGGKGDKKALSSDIKNRVVLEVPLGSILGQSW